MSGKQNCIVMNYDGDTHQLLSITGKMCLTIKPPISSIALQGSLQVRPVGFLVGSSGWVDLRQSYTSRTVELVVNAEIIWRSLCVQKVQTRQRQVFYGCPEGPERKEIS